MLTKRNPDLFWFSHNGITLYSKLKDKDDKYEIKMTASTIELDPFRISVINGAQTVSNFLRASEEVKTLLQKADKQITPKEANEIVNKALEMLKVKTIIISGPGDYVDDISLGLNTQIPVGEDDKVVNLKTTKRINELLSKVNIRIVRSGEYMDNYCMSPQKMIKTYFTVIGEPGKARNLDTKNLETHLIKAESDIRNGIESQNGIDVSLKQAVQASIWWENNSLNRMNASKGIENIMKNACYYFCSYVGKYIEYKKIETPVTDEQYLTIFISMTQKIANINSTREKGKEISSNDFKTDDLFKKVVMMLMMEEDNSNEV